MNEELHGVFTSFCSFGSSRSLNGSLSSLEDPTMDGAKWAKFCRDSGIISKQITTTDVDIFFNKVKGKTARRIDFKEFREALRLIAEKRYGASKSPTEAYTLLVREIINKDTRPIAQATVASNDPITQRMTDHTKYTGSHKLRFDESGKGLGLAGRDQLPKTNELSKITNREPSNIRGVPVSATEGYSGRSSLANTIKRDSAATSSVERLNATSTIKKAANSSSKPASPYTSASNLASSKKPSNGSGSVFDRLTDHSTYTGSHKHRFNEDGSGRGLAGRDAISKGSGSQTVYRGGNVHSISQILRS